MPVVTTVEMPIITPVVTTVEPPAIVTPAIVPVMEGRTPVPSLAITPRGARIAVFRVSARTVVMGTVIAVSTVARTVITPAIETAMAFAPIRSRTRPISAIMVAMERSMAAIALTVATPTIIAVATGTIETRSPLTAMLLTTTMVPSEAPSFAVASMPMVAVMTTVSGGPAAAPLPGRITVGSKTPARTGLRPVAAMGVMRRSVRMRSALL